MKRANMLNTRTINYMELIGNGKVYRVPRYQRDYSWTREQWEDLWNDIAEMRDRPEDGHYLGALVVEAETDRDFLVIDGQQRLATLSLLALAVVARLEAMAAEGVETGANRERAKELRNRFIGEKDPASLIESSRLFPNRTDNDFYQDYLVQIRKPRNHRGLPASNLQLWRCYRYFRDRLDSLDDVRRDGQALTKILSETVARGLLFILITVDDDLNAYTVLETLNARGLELTTTDLLKNYLFSKVKVEADLEALQSRWIRMIATVEQPRFPDFLRYHLLCEHPKIRRRRLFRAVRGQVRSPGDVFRLLGNLESRADLFAAIRDPHHGYWMERPGARPYIRELVLFGARQMTPLLFAAWESFSDRDFVRLLKMIATITFRYSVVSRLYGAKLEPAYHRAAKAVARGEARTPRQVFELLKPVYVDDEKVRHDFARLALGSAGRRKLAKYVLARLESDATGRACDADTDPGTVEHILPENPADAWREAFAPRLWDSMVCRLGNLTLLEAGANRQVGNAAYQEKLPAYAGSGYALTREIPTAVPEAWTPELLEARQRRMAAREVHLWRADY